MTVVKLHGNTYPVKDYLKSLGARWNAQEKVWEIEESLAPVARKVIESVLGQTDSKRCWECGCWFSRDEAQKNGGDWGESYCGC